MTDSRESKLSLMRQIYQKRQLYLMLLPALITVFIFHYIPIYGIQIAFKSFKSSRGIWGSAWVGFDHFVRFVQYVDFWKIVRNTITISLLGILMFPFPVIFALLVNEIRSALCASCALAWEPQGLPFTDTPIEVSIVIGRKANAGDPDDIWFWKFAEKYMNIKFTVQLAEDATLFKQLAFAAGTMPDLMTDMGIGASDLMNYGAAEGQLLALEKYITPELMPNLYGLLETHPNWKSAITTPEGHIYGFPRFSETGGAYPRLYYNTRWLAEMGLTIPTTLDEAIEALYAFKALSEENVPIGSAYNAYPDIEGYLLNALGFMTIDANDVALRNDEVCIPYANREAYGEFLTLMHRLYQDGILSPDYYTLDKTTVSAIVAEDRSLLIAYAPYIFVPATFSEWDAVTPLTSEFNEVRQWLPKTGAIDPGALTISSNCAKDKIETICKFADWFYEDANYALGVYGPGASDTEYLFDGMIGGWVADENCNLSYPIVDSGNSGFASSYDYRMGKILGWHNGWGHSTHKGQTELIGVADADYKGRIYNLSDGDDFYRYTVEKAIMPYVKTGFPEIIFLSEDIIAECTDLKTALDSYATEQTAAFVTGTRSLDTLNDYFDQLDKLGYQEYIQHYTAYYQSYLANQ